jgi:hypothetical protein
VPHDAVRIAYFPDGSSPVPIAANVLIGNGYSNIKLSAGDITKFSAGDYAVIFNNRTRELFRVTGTNGANELLRSNTSMWNTQFQQDFSSSSFVQKVQLITYAYDPSTKEIVFDDHVNDDGFNPSTKTFNSPRVRTLNWSVLASNIESLKIFYTYSSTATGNGTLAETRMPSSALPDLYKKTTCPNQIGYPFFRNVRVEVTLEPAPGSTGADSVTLSRSITPELMRRETLSTELTDKPPYVITAPPTPTPGGSSGYGTQYLGSTSGGF